MVRKKENKGKTNNKRTLRIRRKIASHYRMTWEICGLDKRGIHSLDNNHNPTKIKTVTTDPRK